MTVTNIWRPYTQMKDFENGHTLPLIEKGEGIYLFDDKGNKYIDGISSWWVNSVGHGNKRVAKAIYEQAQKLEQVIFANFTHEPAEVLSKKVLELLPKSITKVFFSDNGSTAVEVGLKMAYQYWQNLDNTKKTKYCSLKNSYHGDTVGAMSVGGVELFHSIFKELFFDVFRIDEPNCFKCPFKLTKESCSINCLSLVEDVFKKHSEEIAAFVIEPIVLAAGGMIVYPPEYLAELSKLCTKYDVLLIVDEVATGFGRTGKMFATEHANIDADIYCLSKCLTGGYLPLAITASNTKVYHAFLSNDNKHKTFYHGHSYTANPISCSAAIETLNIMEELSLIQNVKNNEAYLKNEFHKLEENFDYVCNIRGVGHIWSFDIKEADTNLAKLIQNKALKEGLFIRPLGNVVYLWIPHIATAEEVSDIVNILFKIM